MPPLDIIVVGGGHAGTEAALAAARAGSRVLLLTQNIETIGQMSCNPAVGGVGKGHLVREIDALGGCMAQAADRAGIQFRKLNASRGPAVRATRAQADRALYRAAVRKIVESEKNLRVFQAAATEIVVRNGRVGGVRAAPDLHFRADAVVLTAGTFLGGVIHIGKNARAGGRAGDSPAGPLADQLREINPVAARLKTGTPPRLDGRTIDFAKTESQPGDDPRPVFSFLGNSDDHPPQVCCRITETNPRVHEIIQAAMRESAMFAGSISGVGPRYCPSIEEKIRRFPERPRHRIFLEPEGLDCREFYPNGISTSLPHAVQEALVRAIPGLEQAHITRPGYAIEYDFFDPRALSAGLETRAVGGLFFAGQVNGTTGYEEAAAQGLIAGLNAARFVKNLPPWTPSRDQAYLGVLIDDLVSRGVSEPYRMFTSRAESRLFLREDNADLRLTERGRELGLVSDFRWRKFCERRERLERAESRLHEIRVGDESGHEFLKHPDSRYADLESFGPERDSSGPEKNSFGSGPERDSSGAKTDSFGPGGNSFGPQADSFCPEKNSPGAGLPLRDAADISELEARVKYAGYIRRQRRADARLREEEARAIPADFDFALSGLSAEMREALERARPANLRQARRVADPAALSILAAHLRKRTAAP